MEAPDPLARASPEGAASPSTWVVGYANGSVGYLPARDAFHDPGDYACYCAPRFTTLFPFDHGLEDLLVGESLALLSAVSDPNSRSCR
jgi:hypothetical protein